jgi:glutamate synthase (NADPH/NADH) small chain
MTDKMLKFVKIGQQTPPKRDVGNRKEDFNEIYDDFIKQKAKNNQADVLNVECLSAKFIVL